MSLHFYKFSFYKFNFRTPPTTAHPAAHEPTTIAQPAAHEPQQPRTRLHMNPPNLVTHDHLLPSQPSFSTEFPNRAARCTVINTQPLSIAHLHAHDPSNTPPLSTFSTQTRHPCPLTSVSAFRLSHSVLLTLLFFLNPQTRHHCPPFKKTFYLLPSELLTFVPCHYHAPLNRKDSP
jgi:hypothetical protein